MSKIDAISDLVSGVGTVIDDNTESREEVEEQTTKRLEIDTTSPFILPHLIRPISLLISWVLVTALFIAVICKVIIDPVIMGEVLLMHTTILSFYFRNRSMEKRAESNARANITVIKAGIKEKRKQNRADRRAARKEN